MVLGRKVLRSNAELGRALNAQYYDDSPPFYTINTSFGKSYYQEGNGYQTPIELSNRDPQILINQINRGIGRDVEITDKPIYDLLMRYNEIKQELVDFLKTL